jgi:16S rRNA (guanine966-N2)-methyltransferase
MTGLRIIAGSLKGRKILPPAGPGLRPTSDRLRETLFAVLDDLVPGARVLDAFAGTGALGLEALSRGAASCLFVEQDKPAIDALKTNVAKLGAKGADVRPTSVMALGAAPKPLDLILMDPPYGTSAGSVALDKLARLGWAGPATWISIETAKDELVEVAGFTVDATRVHGKARLTLLRATP